MFCQKFKASVKNLLGQFDKYVENHVETALAVTTAIEKALKSPVADLLTAAIPGDLDEVIKTKLIEGLDKAIAALTIVDDCKACTTTDARLNCFVQKLQQYDPHLQDAVLQKLASLLAGHLDGQRFKQSIYDLFTQAKFTAAA